MKKILFMNNLVYGGGVEKVMSDLISHLPKNEYDITILTPDKDKDFYKYFSNNIKYLFVNKRPVLHKSSFVIRIYNKIIKTINNMQSRDCINKKNFDVVIAMKEGPCMKYVSKLEAPKKLAWIHVDYNVLYWTKTVFKDNEELNCMKKFDNVVCVSNAVRESVIKNVGDPGNLCVKYNPLDEKDILKKSLLEIDDIYIPEGKPLFVTVGRLDEQKGYSRLLNVCKKLNEDKYLYELWIVGEGKERGRLEDFIKQNNLNNVKLLGLKHNPYKYMKRANWFICSSTWESFGIALQESIILGVPIITTYCSGACELLDEDIHGMIVENSEEGILNAMKRAISDARLQSYYKNKIKHNSNYITLENRINSIKELL